MQGKGLNMVRLAVVGCTGKLGSVIMKNAFHRKDVEISYAIARKGNRWVGHTVSELVGGQSDLPVIDEIEAARDCDVFVDCTNAETFMRDSYSKYERMGKPLVIATTAFSGEAVEEIRRLAAHIPVFMSGNFSVALHDFILALKFYARRISPDTDIQIIEYHHNQKKDAPSGTALMIKEALSGSNKKIDREKVKVASIRGGNIFGEHEVVFANSRDEVVTFRHRVSSREAFADGALEVAAWTARQGKGLYNMDDFCGGKTFT